MNKLLFSLGIGFLMCACSNDDISKLAKTQQNSSSTNGNSNQPTKSTTTTFVAQDPRALGTPPGNGGPGVYVAGVAQNKSGVAVATYWKNDSAFSLAAGQSYAYGIAVSGQDVYVVGQQGVAAYWKNGVLAVLSDTYSMANSIFISGGDILMSGFIQSTKCNGCSYATYWKNGIQVNLTDGENSSETNQIIVSGNDIYVAGFIRSGNGNSYAVYWKNGEAVKLTDGTTDAQVSSIAVSGEDVYATIVELSSSRSIAKYWKNGNIINLTDGTSYAQANSIIVLGSDVYIGGTANGSYGGGMGVPVYWKNGVINSVDPSGTTNNAYTHSIAVSNGDVFVAGLTLDSPPIGVSGNAVSSAKFWKNDTAFILQYGSDGINVDYASSIVVVE